MRIIIDSRFRDSREKATHFFGRATCCENFEGVIDSLYRVQEEVQRRHSMQDFLIRSLFVLKFRFGATCCENFEGVIDSLYRVQEEIQRQHSMQDFLIR